MKDYTKEAEEIASLFGSWFVANRKRDKEIAFIIKKLSLANKSGVDDGLEKAAVIAENKFILQAWSSDKRNSGIEIAESIRKEKG